MSNSVLCAKDSTLFCKKSPPLATNRWPHQFELDSLPLLSHAALHESMAVGENQVNDSVNHLADDKLRLTAIRERAFYGGDFGLQFFPELVESLDGMAKR
jgi:hypothetical protein